MLTKNSHDVVTRGRDKFVGHSEVQFYLSQKHFLKIDWSIFTQQLKS